jgi:hypothetical protein
MGRINSESTNYQTMIADERRKFMRRVLRRMAWEVDPQKARLTALSRELDVTIQTVLRWIDVGKTTRNRARALNRRFGDDLADIAALTANDHHVAGLYFVSFSYGGDLLVKIGAGSKERSRHVLDACLELDRTAKLLFWRKFPNAESAFSAEHVIHGELVRHGLHRPLRRGTFGGVTGETEVFLATDGIRQKLQAIPLGTEWSATVFPLVKSSANEALAQALVRDFEAVARDGLEDVAP